MKFPNPRTFLYTSWFMYPWTIFSIIFLLAKRNKKSIKEFEEKVAKYIGKKYAITVPMARTGIYLTIKNTISPGKEVIMSPYTIADVVNMVVCAGGTPVFADVGQNTCNIDYDEITKLINEKTGAVLVTHFYGLSCEIEKITSLCKEKNIPLIEDSAQAFGAIVNNKRIGSFGDAGIFSFGLYKNITSFLGGVVLTDDLELADKLRSSLNKYKYESNLVLLKKIFKGLLADLITNKILFKVIFFWILRFAYINRIGAINNQLKIDVSPELKVEIPKEYLVRLTPLQARLLMHQLTTLESKTAQRIIYAKKYYDELSGIKELTLPPMRLDGSHLYTYFPIQYENRDDLVLYLSKKYRDIQISHHKNCASLECFSKWKSNCSNAEKTSKNLIYLPTYPSYGLKQVEETISVIKQYFSEKL